MSDNTNEEKLRILQERLAQIQQKKEVKQKEKIENSKPVAPVFEEDLVNQEEIDPIAKTPREPRNKSNGLKYLIILFVFCLLGYSVAYLILPQQVNGIFDFNAILDSEEDVEEIMAIEYYKSEFNGNFIIILKNFDKQELANAEVQNLVNDYNCDVFYLPAVSNSKEKIFQTYLGPFNKLEEANQYLNSSEGIQNSGKIINLQ